MGILFFYTLIVAVALVDIKERRIPNQLVLLIFFVGLAKNVLGNGLEGFLFSLQGCAVGFIIFWIQYKINTMGPGDVKLFAAIGSWLGSYGAIQAFFWTAIIGLTIGGFYIVKERRVGEYSQKIRLAFFHFLFFKKFARAEREQVNCSAVRVPYALPIALGAVAYLQFGGFF